MDNNAYRLYNGISSDLINMKGEDNFIVLKWVCHKIYFKALNEMPVLINIF